jgi:hypothetical protein
LKQYAYYPGCSLSAEGFGKAYDWSIKAVNKELGIEFNEYHKYCSRVCCMYSLKFAHLLREKLPEASVYQLYIDMRCAGSGYEEFYERLQAEGSVTKAAKGLIKKGQLVSEGLLNMVEMAFRAYDPCMACATHTLPGQMPLEVVINDNRGIIVNTIRRNLT